MLSEASHHRENVALCSQRTAFFLLSERTPLFYYSSLPLQRSQNIKEMRLFTSHETWHQDCSYAFRWYSSYGITAKKALPNYYS